MGDHNPPLQQNFLNLTQAQRESIVEPGRMGDDQGRETMALAADERRVHAIVLMPQIAPGELR